MDYRKYYKKMSEMAEKMLSPVEDNTTSSSGFVSKPSKKKEEKPEEKSPDQIVLDYMLMFRNQSKAVNKDAS